MPKSDGTSTWIIPLLIISTYQNKTNNLVSNVLLSYQVLPDWSSAAAWYTNMQTDETVFSH